MSHSAVDFCSEPWSLSPQLARKLAATLNQAETETGLTWRIISGYRSPEKQEELRRQGRPTAPTGCSTHTRCPSQGADVAVATLATAAVKATFGRIATENGLRWGGGSPVDDAGIPTDWNHVDTGPVC